MSGWRTMIVRFADKFLLGETADLDERRIV
jgi:hypothetical protein